MRRLNNKGQIDALQPLIVALVVIAIVLVVGFLIFAEVQDQVVKIDSIDESNATGAVTLSCTAVYNTTDNNITIGSGNYTCGVAGLIVTDNYGHVFPSTLYVTYSYQAPDYAYNASSTVQNATQDIPGWLPIIVVVVIGALLIGLVSFLRRQAI